MGNYLSTGLSQGLKTGMNEVGIMKRICEDIEGEGVIQQIIGLRLQVLGGSVLILTYLQNSHAPGNVLSDNRRGWLVSGIWL